MRPCTAPNTDKSADWMHISQAWRTGFKPELHRIQATLAAVDSQTILTGRTQTRAVPAPRFGFTPLPFWNSFQSPATHGVAIQYTAGSQKPAGLNPVRTYHGKKPSCSRRKSHTEAPLRRLSTQNRAIWHRRVPRHESISGSLLSKSDTSGPTDSGNNSCWLPGGVH